MIRPIEFLWKQLNGPQITAVTQAVYQWCINQWRTQIEYFNNLSISTANGSHLSLFGVIANFARPFIRVVDKTFFWFTAEPQENFEHGFADLSNLSVGGIFTSLDKLYESEHGTPLSDSFYRVVLQSYSNSSGEVGSLALLDDLCSALKQFVGNEESTYSITIRTDVLGVQDIGDLLIDLGSQGTWNNWDSVVTAIQALTQTAYAPLPRVYAQYSNS